MAIRKNFCWRIPSEIYADLEALARALALKEGRNVPIAQVLVECVKYGKVFVQRDIDSELVIPSDNLSDVERLASIASQLVHIGAKHHVMPGESA